MSKSCPIYFGVRIVCECGRRGTCGSPFAVSACNAEPSGAIEDLKAEIAEEQAKLERMRAGEA